MGARAPATDDAASAVQVRGGWLDDGVDLSSGVRGIPMRRLFMAGLLLAAFVLRLGTMVSGPLWADQAESAIAGVTTC